MAWKHLNIRKANAALDLLHQQLRNAGRPQEEKPTGHGVLRFFNIGKANAEVDRLQALLDSATPPIISNPISEQPAVSNMPICSPAPVAPRVAGLPGLLRSQLLSALALFPAVAVNGTEDEATLAAMLKDAAANANVRLPGQTVPPAQLRQAALDAIVAAQGHPVTWDLKTLSALVDAVCGPKTAASVTRRPVIVDLEARAKIFAEPGQASPRERAAKYHQQRQAIEANAAPQHAQEDFDKLRLVLLGLGVRVDGLSYAGLPRPCSEVLVGDPKTRAIAQQNADAFMAVLAGDPFAGASTELGAVAARRFIRRETGQFTIGRTLSQRGPQV